VIAPRRHRQCAPDAAGSGLLITVVAHCARDPRHGILLLVHQQPKSKGWEDPETGAFLGFNEVVERLRRLAQQIASGSPEAPQPEIAVLDVSSCARSRAKTAKGQRRSTGGVGG
jgi:hypothetical protein